MIHALFLLLPLALTSVSAEDPPKPAVDDAERAKAALVELRAAFAKSDAGPRLRAIEGAADIDDAEVVRYLGRGLEDKDVAVQGAAIEALRFQPNAKAADELLARAKVKAAKEDATIYAALLRALGQHGDARAIDLFTENPWAAPDAQVIRAKLYGLGRVRTKESLKALTDLMELTGQAKIQPFMGEFRVALWSLTGIDQGQSRDLWLRWYRENKSSVKIAPEPLAEPRELAKRWENYWARPGDADAKRESRGGERRGKGGGKGDGGDRDG